MGQKASAPDDSKFNFAVIKQLVRYQEEILALERKQQAASDEGDKKIFTKRIEYLKSTQEGMSKGDLVTKIEAGIRAAVSEYSETEDKSATRPAYEEKIDKLIKSLEKEPIKSLEKKP